MMKVLTGPDDNQSVNLFPTFFFPRFLFYLYNVNFRKVIVSIAFTCYLAVTCGVMVNFHYCMNRLDSTRFFTAAAETCGKCGMHTDDSHGCCKDDVRIIKLQIDQQTPVSPVVDFSAPAILPDLTAFFLADPVTGIACNRQSIHSPPPLAEKIYLEQRVLRI